MRQWNYLLPIVFLTGAAVLVIEIVAVRILSPYFGNTIFNFSSVLSTILAALSLGYYLGGIRADKDPSEAHFFGLISVSGLLVLAFHALGLFLLPILAYTFSIVEGPLITAFVLFFVPGLLLGMLSPYAIKLQSQRFPERGIGRISGTTFFWSTFGSISGSVGSGFLLIPLFGVNHIMWGTGIFLVLLGSLGLVLAPKTKSKLLMQLIVALMLAVIIPFIPSFEAEAFYTKDGVYERITVVDEVIDGKKARVLRQDKTMSGAVFVDSQEVAFDVLRFHHMAALVPGGPKRILVIGGGAFLVPRELLLRYPQATIDVVEIEPELHKIAQKYFGLPEDSRLRIHIADGRRFLHDSQEPYDLIFADAYHSLYSIPGHFTTQEFFALAQTKLTPQGIFFGNFIGSISRARPALTLSQLRTFQSSFAESRFFALESKSFYDPQNLIFVGLPPQSLASFDERLETVPEDEFWGMLAQTRVDTDRFDLTRYPLLTDDYAPVDYMTTRVARLQARRLADPFILDEGELFELQQQIKDNQPRLEAEFNALFSDFNKGRGEITGWFGQENGRPIHILVAEDALARGTALYFIQTLQTRFKPENFKFFVSFNQSSLDAKRLALATESVIEFGKLNVAGAAVRYNAENSFISKRNIPSVFKNDSSLHPNHVVFDVGSAANHQNLALLRNLLEVLVSSPVN